MSLPRNEAWFPAKRYGWGWGLPQRWQGWLVLLVFVAGIPCGALLARSRLNFILAYLLAMSVGLLLICLWKGESPRWRWGKNDDPPSDPTTGPNPPNSTP